MIIGQVFERFVEESPVSVMVRGLLETILCPQKLDELFEKNAKTQYTKELLFSTVVEMMNTVTCGIRPSIHATYQAKTSQMNVSVTSVYNKLNAMEVDVSAELIRETGTSMEAIIRHLNGSLPDWLPGYRLKILDGNAIGASEHRLKPLRDCNSTAITWLTNNAQPGIFKRIWGIQIFNIQSATLPKTPKGLSLLIGTGDSNMPFDFSISDGFTVTMPYRGY
nr:hypothetical protein [Nostoc sp. FACHB-133]